MRLATYNVHHGAPAHGPAAFDETIAVCRALDADLLTVQELDRDVDRSGHLDEPTLLSTTLARQASFAETVRIGEHGRYGHALLSAHELSNVEWVGLAVTTGREPRTAILATTEVDGVAVEVCALHLENARRSDRGEPMAQAQARLAFELVSARSDTTGHAAILMGDLNLDAAPTLAIAAAAGFTLADGPSTYPSSRPRKRIDHVAVRGLTITRVEVPASDASDHRPLVVTARPAADRTA